MKMYTTKYEKNEIPTNLKVIKDDIVIEYYVKYCTNFEITIRKENDGVFKIEEAQEYLDNFISQLINQKEEEYTRWILTKKEYIGDGYKHFKYEIDFRIKDMY